MRFQEHSILLPGPKQTISLPWPKVETDMKTCHNSSVIVLVLQYSLVKYILITQDMCEQES